jgi:hypothetical protein
LQEYNQSALAASEDAARDMARQLCLPALCIAFASLAVFFIVMDPCYRRTFYANDSRRAMHRRHWEEADASPERDAKHSEAVLHDGHIQCEWIEQNAARWKRTPPSWYTEAWRKELRSNAHWLGE